MLSIQGEIPDFGPVIFAATAEHSTGTVILPVQVTNGPEFETTTIVNRHTSDTLYPTDDTPLVELTEDEINHIFSLTSDALQFPNVHRTSNPGPTTATRHETPHSGS